MALVESGDLDLEGDEAGQISLEGKKGVKITGLKPGATLDTPAPTKATKTDGKQPTSEHEAQPNTTPRFQIKRDKDFLESLDGKSIDSKLLQTIEAFGQHLILTNQVSGDIVLGEGMRDAKKAHRWSTSYSIRNDRVPLKALEALPNGRDMDGNQWYEKSEKMGQVNQRAASLGLSSPSTVAAEGYPAGDSRRAPNTWDRGISNHLLGKAIDVSIPWTTEKGGQLNDPVANELIKKFGLKRPVPKEKWHFELLQGSEQGDEEHGHAKES